MSKPCDLVVLRWQVGPEGRGDRFLTECRPSLQFTVFMDSAILVAVVHYCNFCQFSSWMRSSLATVVGAGPLFLLYVSLCPDRYVGRHGSCLALSMAGPP